MQPGSRPPASAPGGWLILLEGTGRERILDLVFGLTAGWWKYADQRSQAGLPADLARVLAVAPASEGFTGRHGRRPDTECPPGGLPGPCTRDCFRVKDAIRAAHAGTWLILGDEPGIAGRSAQRLEAEEARCSVVDPDAFQLGQRSPIPGSGRVIAVALRPLPASAPATLTWSTCDDWSQRRTGEFMNRNSPRTAVAFSGWKPRGARRSGEDVGKPILGGHSRTCREWTHRRSRPSRWIDLDPAVPVESSLDQLVCELLDPDDEPFVAFRDGQRFVAARETHGNAGRSQRPMIRSIEELRDVEPADRRQRIQDAVCSELARTLRLPDHAIELDRPMVSFGLDSLMAIQLKNRVEALAGVSISIVKLLEGLTVAQLAAEIDEALSSDERPARARTVRLRPTAITKPWLAPLRNGDMSRARFPLTAMTRSTALTISRSWSSMN